MNGMMGQTTTNQDDNNLAALLRQLLAIIPADKVFRKDCNLYIAIGEQAARGLQQYKNILEASGWEPGGYRYALYTISDICHGLEMETGSLFHTAVFVPEHVVYDSGQSTLPEPLPRRLQRIRSQGGAEFALGYQRSVQFLNGAVYHLAANETEVAAFMLHQSVELLLRGLLLAMSGKELKSHLLGELLLHTSRYLPGIQQAFYADLKKLEQAYSCGRYALHYHITEPEVSGYIPCITALQREVKSFFEANMEAYEQGLICDRLAYNEAPQKHRLVPAG